jgi:autophagy-related protein 9
MSKSRLLSPEYSDDDEFTLNPVHDTPRQRDNNVYSEQPQQYYASESSEDDLEAPTSLILDKKYVEQQLPKPISTRERVTTYDRTMWRWANVENMDNFFERVYEYYNGKGIYCILLARFLNLL